MKKIVVFVLAVVSILIPASVRAQSNVAVGLTGGLNILTAKVYYYDFPKGGTFGHLLYSGNSSEFGFAFEIALDKMGFFRVEGFSSSGQYVRTSTDQYLSERPQTVDISMPGLEFDLGLHVPLVGTWLSFLGHFGFTTQFFQITSSDESILDGWGGGKVLLNAGAGFQFHISRNIFVEFEYSYIAGLAMSTSQSEYTGWDVSMDGSRVTLGIFYKL